MNKRTTALTTEQYREIIITMKEGGAYVRTSGRLATISPVSRRLTLGDGMSISLDDITEIDSTIFDKLEE